MKRVFLSFLAEDAPTVNGLRLLSANPRHQIEFYDESVRTPFDSANADYIKRQIRDKINRTSITVCVLSQNTYASSWVRWELEISQEKGNRIIAMGVPGLTHANLPAPIVGQPWYLWDVNFLAQEINRP
jgi:hypothetical protein